MSTKIEWTDESWNPVTGCTKISLGCKNCYAERLSKRLKGMGIKTYQNGFEVTMHSENLYKPLEWKRRRMVFICSMADLFHEKVTDEFIFNVFKVIAKCPHLTFQILTKRSNRMKYLMPIIRSRLADRLENVWLGVSVENMNYAMQRIPDLLQTTASVRFVSFEPLLERIDLYRINEILSSCNIDCKMSTGIDWIIVGCENGPGKRYTDINWVREIKDYCRGAKIPLFFKQIQIGNKVVKMPLLDGKVWNQYPGEYK